MAHLFSVGVSRLGLSGRGPQGVSQTSSTRRLLKICAQQRTWSTVGGSKAPPKTATRTFCGGVAAPLSAAMRRNVAEAMINLELQCFYAAACLQLLLAAVASDSRRLRRCGWGASRAGLSHSVTLASGARNAALLGLPMLPA